MWSPDETEPNINKEIYERALKNAESVGSPKCVFCGKHLFYHAEAAAFGPGHIYSILGKRESRLSGSCEYCFDEMFKEEDDVAGGK